jgi:hypothetical protein
MSFCSLVEWAKPIGQKPILQGGFNKKTELVLVTQMQMSSIRKEEFFCVFQSQDIFKCICVSNVHGEYEMGL